MSSEDEQQPRQPPVPTIWDWEPDERRGTVPERGAVVAVRFTGDELDRVAAAADRHGLKLTQYIHDIVLGHVRVPPAAR